MKANGIFRSNNWIGLTLNIVRSINIAANLGLGMVGIPAYPVKRRVKQPMSKKNLWGALESEPDLTNLEAYLKANFLPVKPRHGFVRDLHKRLLSSDHQEVEAHGLRNGLLAIAGLATSVLILIAGVRATIAFLSSVGILHQVKEHVQQNQAAPMNPAL